MYRDAMTKKLGVWPDESRTQLYPQSKMRVGNDSCGIWPLGTENGGFPYPPAGSVCPFGVSLKESD